MDEQEQGAVFVDEKAFTDVDAKKKKRRERFIIVFSVLAFIFPLHQIFNSPLLSTTITGSC